MGDWIIEAERGGDFGLFYTYSTGYETAAKAKMAAARALKSKLHARRARVVFEGDGPTVIYETTFRPGERAKWAERVAPRTCKYGDPFCPCQDGDQCHYEGDNPMVPPETPNAEVS